MKNKQNILKIVGVVIMLLLIVFVIWFLINQNKKEKKTDKSNPSVTTPASPSATPVPTSAPVVTPTLDAKLTDEEKAIQVIVNQGVYKKSELAFVEKTGDGLFKIESKKESSTKKKTYYLVDINTQNYEKVSELKGAGSGQ